MSLQEAVFGNGCFWCTEAIFSSLKGVIDVSPGYSGGITENPSYEEVCTGTTGHAEVCKISFDSSVISYLQLLEVFWRTHDPTTLNRQGPDLGTQYRSVIFYLGHEQKQQAELSKKKLEEAKIWGNPVVTEIKPLTTIYLAEEYHKNYYESNPGNQYCSVIVTPKINKFREVFKTLIA